MTCTDTTPAATIDRGRVFAQQIDFDGDPDLSADSWSAQLRKSPDPDSDLYASFTVDTTDAATGSLVLRLTQVQTDAIVADDGWYDLLRTTGSQPTTIFDRPLLAVIRDMPSV